MLIQLILWLCCVQNFSDISLIVAGQWIFHNSPSFTSCILLKKTTVSFNLECKLAVYNPVKKLSGSLKRNVKFTWARFHYITEKSQSSHSIYLVFLPAWEGLGILEFSDTLSVVVTVSWCVCVLTDECGPGLCGLAEGVPNGLLCQWQSRPLDQQACLLPPCSSKAPPPAGRGSTHLSLCQPSHAPLAWSQSACRGLAVRLPVNVC